MADVGSLGEYKVVVTADYSQLKTQFDAMSNFVSSTTKVMSDNLNKTMGGINATMISQLKTTVDQLKKSFDGLDTTTKKGGDGFKTYAQQIKEAEKAAQKCHQEISALQEKMANSSSVSNADVARLKELKAEFRELRERADDLKAAQADYNMRIKETQNLEAMAAKAKKQADQEGLKALRDKEKETRKLEEAAKKAAKQAEEAAKKAGDGFKNYAQQIKAAKAEMEKAFQKADELQTRYNLINNDSVHGRADLAYLKESKLVDTARDLKEAKAEAERLRIQYDRLVEAQKRFKEYAGQTQTAQKEQIREAVAGANAQIKALDRQAKANSQMLQGQMRSVQQVQEAERRTDRQREQNATRQQQRIAHLQTQYRVAYEEANKYLQTHAQMSEAVFIRLQGRLTAFSAQLQALGAMPAIINPLAGMNYQQYISGFSKLNDVLKSVKHHLMWMASAAVIGAGFGIPLGVSKAIEAFDALQTKIMQNMELANQYAGNTERLHSDMNKMGEAAKTMAQGFGVSLNEVQEGMQIVTRRFKDADTAIYLTSIALQMSKLDMVDVKQSAKDLEAVMLQFGMGAKDAGKFLNDFSVICHVARISGTDMLMALERSGSAFKAMNMDARAAMAAIAAVSTVTGKSGATIGDSWKSILANMDFKKATQALEAYNIKLYEVGANGAKTMRSGTAVLSEILATYQKLDDEGRRKLATAIAGGRLILAA